MREALDLGIVFGLPHPLEIEAARAFIPAVPCAERVRFLKSGAEANSYDYDIVFRAARTARLAVGLDVTFRMLKLAAAKPARPRAPLVAGDMLALPFPSRHFTAVTTGYGLRNVPDLEQAIDEIARVLAPGGRLLSLDFNRPAQPLLRAAYLLYLTIVGSTLGFVLHRDPDTYRYIPESIRNYPGADGVARLLERRGFVDVRVVPLLGGLMAIHVARLPF